MQSLADIVESGLLQFRIKKNGKHLPYLVGELPVRKLTPAEASLPKEALQALGRQLALMKIREQERRFHNE